jgi:hypothetical protein
MAIHFGCPPCIERDKRQKEQDLATQALQMANDSSIVDEYMRTDAAIKRISELAHQYWLDDGKPDGEEYRDHRVWGRMKIRDIHWRRASNVIAGDFAHNGG